MAELSSSSQELLARGFAPIKAEHLKPRVSAAAAATGAVATASQPAAKEGKEGQSTAMPAKSKRQQRKDVKEQRKMGDLCTNFLLEKCTFGDRCKFNHDIQAYLSTRLPDLPGRCPFSSQPKCPYGITCRYAGTHTQADPLQQQLQDWLTAQKAEQGTNGSAEEAAAAAASSAVSDIPARPVELLVPEKIEQVLNNMSKDVQIKLWKSRYDFSKADDILKAMGLRLSFKSQKQAQVAKGGQQSKNSKGQRNQSQDPAAQEPAAAPDAAAVDQAQAASAAAAADPEVGAAGGEAGTAAGLDAAGDAEGPEAKRQRTEGATDAAGAAAAVLDSAKGAHMEVPLRREEKRVIDFRGKTVLAPLTTVGNLPYRRVCKGLGADVTIGEMAMATNLLQGQASEWALLKRHPCEDVFGVQIAGGFPDAVARVCQLIDESTESVDWVDINMGCPIDIVCDRGAGSALLLRPKKIEEIARAADRSMSLPLTLKTRKGYYDDQDITHTFVDQIRGWGPIALTLHGRTRQQRYSRQADWDYIKQCASVAAPSGLQLIGNGDVFSYTDWNRHVGNGDGPIAACMIGRGALIKPWVFTEIREQRHWDISAGERLDLLRSFASAGLEHWGSDSRGVENTRKFMLEWLSYLHRYIPVGLLEVIPQKLNQRPPAYYARSDLEQLMASDNPSDWIRISELLLGPTPPGFIFTPKHNSNSYSAASALGNANGQGAAAAPDMDDQAEG